MEVMVFTLTTATTIPLLTTSVSPILNKQQTLMTIYKYAMTPTTITFKATPVGLER